MKKSPGDFLGTLKNLLIPTERQYVPTVITNNTILDELLDCFDASCNTESVGSSLLFNMHFLVILHPDVYEQRLASLPVVVKEAVKLFYKKLSVTKRSMKTLRQCLLYGNSALAPLQIFMAKKLHLLT